MHSFMFEDLIYLAPYALDLFPILSHVDDLLNNVYLLHLELPLVPLSWY